MAAATPQEFLTLGEIVGSIRSRWFGILCTTILLTGLITLCLVLIPNTYQSDALLYVKMGRGTVSLDPTSTAASQTISLMDRRQSEINSVREMLKSRIVLDRAVRQVGVDRILEHDAWWNKLIASTGDRFELSINSIQDKYLKQRLINNDILPQGFTKEQFEAQEDLELAIKRLFSSLSIDAAKESYTLGVAVRAYQPELAQELCQAIVNEYRKVHVEAHSMEGSLQFFESEYAASQQRLADAESKLRDEKNRTSLMTVTGKQELIHQEIRQLQTDRIKADAELAAAQGRDAEIARKMSNLPEKLDLEKTAGVANSATDAMRNQLFELEVIEKDLVSKYSPEHPLVVQVRTKLKEARNIYDQQKDERTLSKVALNPIRQEMELDRLRNLSALEGWKAQSSEIAEKLAAAEQKAAQLNSDELNINELERSVQLARNDVLTYGRKREEARFLKQLDIGNFSDISVPQPPMLVFKHVAPKRSLLLPIGAIGALAVSCCLAVWKGPRTRKQTDQRDATVLDASTETASSSKSVAASARPQPKKVSAERARESELEKLGRSKTANDSHEALSDASLKDSTDDTEGTAVADAMASGVQLSVQGPIEPLVKSH